MEYEDIPTTRIRTWCRLKRLAPFWFACAVMLISTGDAHAQEEPLQAAIAAYDASNFDEAIELLAGIAEMPDADEAARREALQWLGRAYTAKRMHGDVREVIDELLALEPPPVELDPDVEPLPLMKVYYEARRDHSDSYEVDRNPNLQTLAVMGFTNNSIDQQERFASLDWGLASMLISSLGGATDLKVIERERLQWVLEEHELQRDPSLVDQSTAVRMGRILGAQSMLLGNFIVMGRDMRIDARLVDVETGEILMSEQVTDRSDNLFDLVDELSLKVAQGINITLSERTPGVDAPSRSLDAQISYLDGLELLEQERYREAYEKFLEALQYDPDFAGARRKADSIEPMLAAG
jgi:TolB-like protein